MKLQGKPPMDFGTPPSIGTKHRKVLDDLLNDSQTLLNACETLKTESIDYAQKEELALQAKAKAFAQTVGKNKEEREANADSGWATQREAALIAKVTKEAQLELVRSLRQRLSALQTWANSHKAEADAVHFGQSE